MSNLALIRGIFAILYFSVEYRLNIQRHGNDIETKIGKE
jgi:hypothetical protein